LKLGFKNYIYTAQVVQGKQNVIELQRKQNKNKPKWNKKNAGEGSIGQGLDRAFYLSNCVKNIHSLGECLDIRFTRLNPSLNG